MRQVRLRARRRVGSEHTPWPAAKIPSTVVIDGHGALEPRSNTYLRGHTHIGCTLCQFGK